MSLDTLSRMPQVRGNLQEADKQLSVSLRLSQRAGYKDVLASTIRSLSSQAYWQGHFQRVIYLSQERLTLSRHIHDGYLEVTGLFYDRRWCKRFTNVLPIWADKSHDFSL
jgi:hypothetical protein